MTDWGAVCPAAWQARVVDTAVEVLPTTPGIVAGWLGGSLATGAADVYSDVDLHVAVEDEQLDAWLTSWPAVVERCAGPLILAQRIGGGVIGGLALTAEWRHVDFIVHARSGLGQPDPCRILHDPAGVLEERLVAPTPGDPYYPAADITLFFYLLGNFSVTLGRGELVVAHGGVVALRELLVRLMLAEDGVHKRDGQKRLNPHLTAEQQAVLERLPAPAVTADQISAACREIRDEFVARAWRLADATKEAFPEELINATEQHLRRHLGPSWTP